MSIQIQLQQFEGPLDLLLYLIRKEEMDIMDINVHEITKQYLDYIKLMKELDLEVAGEFVSMASTLIHIKSRLLLPQYDENGEILEQEDPRKELVQKLLEYQKYQEASKMLYERPLVGRDVFLRGTRETLEAKEDEIVLEDNALFSLISSYRRAMKTIKKRIHKVTNKMQSIASRILDIKDRLVVGQKVLMSELITAMEGRQRQVLITFLSILELGKMGFVSLYQTETYGEIYIEATKEIAGDAVSRVEEYDNMNAEEVAAAMMLKAQKYDEKEDLFENPNGDQLALGQNLNSDQNENFELKDGFEGESFDQLNHEVAMQEMATDEDILNAELEFSSEPDSLESVVGLDSNLNVENEGNLDGQEA